MVTSLHRRRRSLASLILGVWLFGLFVGIAHACGLDGVTPMRHHPAAARIVDQPSPDGMPPGCEKFCNDDLPLIAKVQPVQDLPGGQPLVLAAHHESVFAPIPTPVLDPALAAHPPPGVPLSIRFVRLTL
jgi:hypothetical protein